MTQLPSERQIETEQVEFTKFIAFAFYVKYQNVYLFKVDKQKLYTSLVIANLSNSSLPVHRSVL